MAGGDNYRAEVRWVVQATLDAEARTCMVTDCKGVEETFNSIIQTGQVNHKDDNVDLWLKVVDKLVAEPGDFKTIWMNSHME